MRRPAVLLAAVLVAAGGGCGGGDSDDTASGTFCDRAREFDAEFADISAEIEGDDVPSARSFSAAADAISDFADAAPSAIDDALESMADAMRTVAREREGLDLAVAPEDLTDEAARAMLETGERMAAVLEGMEDDGQRVAAHLEDECGISLDDEG